MLAGHGREQHPNNFLPLSKRRRVEQWDLLGLVPMQESNDQQATSDGDSGRRGGTGARAMCLVLRKVESVWPVVRTRGCLVQM